ncbi:hypothetical protein RF11_01631 [Thelohanellus kitauei]|uniref:Uncharacterized protein n=1 Tax=Thelohanellus kitauei TaxID=669202 RepID=A0A0C2JLA2_THEKT|nr:hypothetical protein RF11_01631 [Thelohanellus kitauei]
MDALETEDDNVSSVSRCSVNKRLLIPKALGCLTPLHGTTFQTDADGSNSGRDIDGSQTVHQLHIDSDMGHFSRPLLLAKGCPAGIDDCSCDIHIFNRFRPEPGRCSKVIDAALQQDRSLLHPTLVFPKRLHSK